MKLYLTVEAGYTVKDYTIGEETNLVPEDNIILIPVTSDEDINVTINFEAIKYPILAYFNGIPEPVEADENNKILVPDGWLEGIGFVDFKIKVCEVDGEFQPDNGITECDPDSQFISEIHWIQDLSNDNGYYLIQGGSRLFIFENFF